MPSDQFVPYGRHRLPLSELFDLLESEYIELERATMNPRSFSFATSMDNMMKNRYFNILANEDTLFPPLAAPSATPPAAPTPYINANAIDLQVNPLFVASQAPTPSCMADFFTTLLEQRISLIIMLTDTVEGVMPKADPYWPLDSTDQRLAAGAAPEEEMSVPGTNIVVCKDPQRPFTRDDKLGLIWRPMLLKQPDRSPHRLLQVQYVGWPDHGVPSTTEGFDRLIELTRSYSDLSSYQKKEQQKQQPSSEVVSSSPEVDANLAQLNATGPVLVHCSAGIGRTGTFIGAYTAISRLATKRLSEKTIQQVVLKMRRARFGMVQRFEQYIFIHQVTMNALGADTSSFAAMAPRRAMDYDVKVMQAMKVMKEREALKRQVQGKP